jgi:hypothetical protein
MDPTDVFGSVTDLTTGRERPADVQATPEYWTLTVEDCTARSLLRMYWPLARANALR